MTEKAIIGLGAIVVLGIGSQWLAWRLRLPSILFLLVVGFAAGQTPGLLDPDELFGELLLPLVSLSVALILFEGGLSLRLRELRQVGRTVISLVTVGVALSWVLTVAAAHWILELDLKVALLLGALLVVTGPTVIGPLLRLIRPTGKVAAIAKWEGITIDPIGVLLAVIVYEVIVAGHVTEATSVMMHVLGKTLLAGGLIGVAAALILLLFLRRYWIPDHLQEAVTLMTVVGAFLLANHFQDESGLFTVTLMGILLANQKQVEVGHIVAFKETLRTLMISSLFIILAARLDVESFSQLDWHCGLFLAVLILIVRPAVVYGATLGSGLTHKERLFLAWLAPRGIVAAAVSSVFAIRLAELDVPGAEFLVPVTFAVIVATVALYGLTAPLLAQKMGLSQQNPQGVLFVGAHAWARAIAKTLQEEKLRVLLVDSNRPNIYRARMDGLETFCGSILREHVDDEIDLSGIGKLLALTPNDEANSLATVHFTHYFGREQVYQLSPWKPAQGKDVDAPRKLHGRFLFEEGANYSDLNERFARQSVVKRSRLSEEYDYEAFRKRYGEDAILLFVINEDGRLLVNTRQDPLEPKPDQTVIALVQEEKTQNGE